ncbi:hypothetical protein DFH09DRAFT_1315686 [Mycena vulgaris]|nr:hypothetical protein DFH09DRAFT_1315686 [Mycena vulgaris]
MLTLAERLSQWNLLNVANRLIIAAAAMKTEIAETVNVALLLSCADERAGSKTRLEQISR